MKRIEQDEQKVPHQHSNAWEVMKPFVHFGVKTMGLITKTLIAIVRNIPKPNAQKPPASRSKIIKI